MNKKIVVIDDEPSVQEVVRGYLEKDGYLVYVAGNGEDGLALAERTKPGLVVLDLMLPGLDGLEVCRRIQRERRVPVLMLTARDSEADLLVGLGVGADDYMTKPFSLKELVARVKAVLRRAREPASEEAVTVGELRVDFGKHLIWVKGKPVELTAKEFDLLRALLEAKGRVLGRELLLDRVWGLEQSLEIETRTVDVHVGQLRKKLKNEAKRLVTVKGAGYRFDSDAP